MFLLKIISIESSIIIFINVNHSYVSFWCITALLKIALTIFRPNDASVHFLIYLIKRIHLDFHSPLYPYIYLAISSEGKKHTCNIQYQLTKVLGPVSHKFLRAIVIVNIYIRSKNALHKKS